MVLIRGKVNGYLKWCKELKHKLEKPYSGRLNVRISPELHIKLDISDKAYGESLNSFVQKVLERSVG